MNLFSSRHAAIIAAGSLAAIVSVAMAQAATDKIYKYSTPKTGMLSIHPMAMAPDGADSLEYSIDWFGSLTPSSGEGCFNTGLNLPQGATITKLTVWYSSGATGDMFVDFRRLQLSNGEGSSVAFEFITDDSGIRKAAHVTLATAPADLVVNNNHYAYALGVCLGAGDRFFGARVAYTYTHAGD